MEENQAVVTETDEQAKPASEESGAQEQNLNDVLAEFEAGTQQAEITDKADKAESVTDEQINKAVERAMENSRAKDKSRADIEESAKTILGATGAHQHVAQDFLQGEAARDPRVATAFTQRYKNPDAWQKVLKGLAGKFSGSLGSPIDQSATDDRNAMAAAVKSATTKAPTDAAQPNLEAMNNSEFNEFLRNQGR